MPIVPFDSSLERKKAAARSWILLDSNGETMALEVDKQAIMHRVGIHARDLRILDPILSYPSTILGRERAIVFNLEHIKGIITANEVLLRNPTDEFVIPIVEQLCRRLPTHSRKEYRDDVGQSMEKLDSNSHLSLQKAGREADGDADYVPPFEFRALEVALEAICSFLDARATELEAAAYPALDELTRKVSSKRLDGMRKLKSAISRLTARVQKVRDELEQLLDDDGDMAHLFLSRKIVSPTKACVGTNEVREESLRLRSRRFSRSCRTAATTPYLHSSLNDVEELGMLLEAYFMQIDGTLNKVITLREYIDDTEDYINIQLDNYRNRLIQLELILSSATLVLSVYSLIAGIFGVNLPYEWNDGYDYLFKWVIVLGFLGCLSLFLLILAYARYKRLIGT